MTIKECVKCIDKKIHELTEKIRKAPNAIGNLVWRKELDKLKNKRCIAERSGQSECCDK